MCTWYREKVRSPPLLYVKVAFSPRSAGVVYSGFLWLWEANGECYDGF
jgi:hypothetical protein